MKKKLTVLTEPEELTFWREAAYSTHQSLSSWVRVALNAQAGLERAAPTGGADAGGKTKRATGRASSLPKSLSSAASVDRQDDVRSLDSPASRSEDPGLSQEEILAGNPEHDTEIKRVLEERSVVMPDWKPVKKKK